MPFMVLSGFIYSLFKTASHPDSFSHFTCISHRASESKFYLKQRVEFHSTARCRSH
ncbi:hypothetical protein QNE60_005004 [Vibrio harveyi]|nr:hypothetical protein [Vibrio harveyi]